MAPSPPADGSVTSPKFGSPRAAIFASDSGFTVPAGPFARGNGGGAAYFDDVLYLGQENTDDTSAAPADLISRGNSGVRIGTSVNLAISTSNPRGGRAGSWSFTGSTFSSRHIAGTDADPFDFYDRTIPLTVEAFIRPDSGAISGSQRVILAHWNTSGNNRQWSLELNSGKPRLVLSTDGASSSSTTTATSALIADTSVHICLTRDASAVYRVCLDGVMVCKDSSLTGTDLFNVASGSGILRIGGTSGGANAWTGLMDNVRITHGVDRYGSGDSSFTPPSGDSFPAYAVAA